MADEIACTEGDPGHPDGAANGPVSGRLKLDPGAGVLLRDGTPLPLRPKTLAVLAALAARPGAVVHNDVLRERVWGRRFGNEAGPKQCIRELRRVLGDSTARPRFIETVGRQGYRLLAPVEIVAPPAPTPRPEVFCVGRAAELAAMTESLGLAEQGVRTTVFLAGEAGAGKTRLADAFVATLPNRNIWTAHGQCIPLAGAREPYGPLFDIVRELATGRSGAAVVRMLRQAAPSWLAQLPGLGRSGPAGRRADGIPTDSMARELSDFLELLAQRAPGVIVLEDLHWADPSTLAWLGAWGRRRAPAQIQVVATYRVEEADGTGDLGVTVRELGRTPGFRALTVNGLEVPAVAELLARRFDPHAFPETLAHALVQRTEGHAILVDGIIDQWAAQGDIRQVDGSWVVHGAVRDVVRAIAPDVRVHIERGIEGLGGSDRRLLEAASVAGMDFSPADLAGNRPELEDIEYRLEQLARRQHIVDRRDAGPAPDGGSTMRYRFRHALYREALYDGIPTANRQRLHREIGGHLETAHGDRAHEIAPALAEHFERGGDIRRAAHYRGLSAAGALARGAAAEAAEQFREALELHRRSAGDRDSRTPELGALLGLGAAIIMSEGFTAPELPAIYERAHALSGDAEGMTHAVVPVLAGRWNYHVSRAEIGIASRLADDLGRAAADAPAAWRMAAHNAAGITRWFSGAPADALPHIAAVLALHAEGSDGDAAATLGEDPVVVCRQYAACVQQLLGDGAAAEAHFAAGMARAGSLDQPFGVAQMLWAGALIAHARDDPALVLERARALVDVCERSTIAFWLPAGRVMAGWARVMLGDPAGLAELQAGCDAYAAMEVRLSMPHCLALLAEATARCGGTTAGFGALIRALRTGRTTGERWYEAELHRGWGELSLRAGRPASARRAFSRALALARRQDIPAFAARAAARLAALPG
jgi:DNA-binding winged helix-turn-helix (wHTH) protein